MKLNISLMAISIFSKYVGFRSEIYFCVPWQVGSWLGFSVETDCGSTICYILPAAHVANVSLTCTLQCSVTFPPGSHPLCSYSLSKSSHLWLPCWFLGFAVVNLGLLLLWYLGSFLSDVLLQFWLHRSNRFVGGELTFYDIESCLWTLCFSK